LKTSGVMAEVGVNCPPYILGYWKFVKKLFLSENFYAQQLVLL